MDNGEFHMFAINLTLNITYSSLAWSLKAAHNFKCVVDPPLETSKGTNHNDTGTKTVPKTCETDSFINLSGCTTLFVHNRNHSVSWVRNNCAEDTSPVTSQEGDTQLLILWVTFTRSCENISIKESNCLFESNKLHNGIRDLSAP